MIVLIILLASFFRLFRFPELSWFYGDQGIDLMVAQRVLRDGVWPVVGPYLSVFGFSVAPTYYWLLSLFLWIGKTPEVVTLFFVGMDLLTVLFLYYLARVLVDKKAGYIASGLWAISPVIIDHARNMWQPHPVQLPLVASLYFLARSRLVAAWSLYCVAFSIYPSPIALLPFYLYHSRHAVKHVRLLGLAALGFLLPFLPWVMYEMRHGWPTYTALFTGSFGSLPWKEMVVQFFLNLIGIFGMTTGLFSLHPWFSPLIVPVLIGLFFSTFSMARMRFHRHARYHRAFTFLAPWWLAAGFIGLLLFRDMGAVWHRLYGFLPFIFLAIALVIRIALAWRYRVYRLAVLCIVSLFFLGNVMTFLEYASLRIERYTNPTDRSRRVAAVIDASARSKRLTDADFSVIAYIPLDVWSYAATPELYFLRELRDYPVTFTEAGNDLDRAVWGNDGRRYIYFLCKEYTRQEDIEHTCLGTFAARNPNYRLEKRLLFDGDTTVFLFGRR